MCDSQFYLYEHFNGIMDLDVTRPDARAAAP